jgi:DNA topoisomerase-1
MKIDSATAANLAGLVISDRKAPGISRTKVEIPAEKKSDKPGIRWDYTTPDGKALDDEERLSALNFLAVPPAWTDVWYCADESGHIQATGKDGKGRLQYRYHPDWIKIKSDLKFAGVDEFALTLPNLRQRVEADLELEGMPRDKVVALVVRLMDIFHIRIGSDEYAKQNDSYGLTTMREGHVEFIKGERAEGEIDAIFDFPGKSGKRWRLLIEDDELAHLIEASGKVGGKSDDQDVFRYEDDNGNDFDIKGDHINSYIRDAINDEDDDGPIMTFTAKAFRTWAASWKTGARLALIAEASESEIAKIPVLFAEAEAAVEGSEDEPIIVWQGVRLKRVAGLAKLAVKGNLPGTTEKQRQTSLLAVIDTVAGDLGNTRAVCRSSYIRPMFMDDWNEGIFMARWSNALEMPQIPDLDIEESAAVHYMRQHE